MTESTASLRALVVDDEPLARELVVKLLRSEPGFEICGVAASGRQALTAIAELRPDIVFIDIRMPELNGISVIRDTDFDAAPLFVVVTAFESHAVEAFEVRAFDYVLKPVDKARFSRAARDARAAVLNRRALARMNGASRAAMSDEQARPAGSTHLRLRAGERVLLAPLDAVRYFEACSQYVRVYVGDASYLLSTESLASLESQVTPDTFFRVHRSYLVNRRFVESVVAKAGGGSSVVLAGGERLPVARRNREVAERLLVKLAERLGPASGGG
ncbi:MAG: LytTR family DNA-binding domain-containing protein, partial [Steroidobacteraceae bacterium]